MRSAFIVASRLLVLPVLCATLWADPPASWIPEPEVKLRMGWTPKEEDHLRQAAFSYGFNLNWHTPIGQAGFEVGNFYKTGDLYAGSFQPVAAGKLPIDTTQSVEQKRDGLKGLCARFSLKRALPDPDWAWQAGLMVGGTQYRQEMIGDSRSLPWAPGVANAWRDIYIATPTKGGLTTSPYAGMAWRVSTESSLEVNLLFLNYKSVDYIHVPGGSPTYATNVTDTGGNPVGPLADYNNFPSDHLAIHTRFVPHLEVGWTFHF